MSPGRVEDYISRLESELRRRGIDDQRVLAEAREHLLDAVEEGRQRGLSVEEAEQEALERFGAPGVVAAHVHKEREDMSGVTVLRRVWQRKWWILAPTVIAAVVASVSSSFLPIQYRSEATLLVVPQRVPENHVRPAVTSRIEDRLRRINRQVRSRTKLERIIEDLNLYADRRRTDIMQDIIDDMSDAISVDIVQGDVFRVAFSSEDPRTAKLVTERLTTYIIDENPRDRTVLGDTTALLETRIADLGRQIVEYEKRLKGLESENGAGPLSQAEGARYVALQETYRELSTKRIDAQVAASVERRQIGERFRILDPARVPEAPEDPNRVRVTLIGALVGLLIGLVLVVRRRGTGPGGVPPALAEA